MSNNGEELVSPHFGAIKTSTLPSCMIELDDLTKLFEIMDRKIEEVLDKEVEGIFNTLTEKERSGIDKSQLREMENVAVEVQGINGQYHIYYNSTDINKDNLPIPIQSIKFKTLPDLENQDRYQPDHQIVIKLNFEMEDWFDLTLATNTQSYQNSFIQVSGSDDTWVNGTYKEIFDHFNTKKQYRTWIHKGNTYNFLFILLGVPLSIIVGNLVDGLLSDFQLISSNVIHTSFVIYSIILSMSIFRFLFNVIRFLFPFLEFPTNYYPKLKFWRWLIGVCVGGLSIGSMFI